MLRTSDHYADSRQTVVTFGVVIFSAVNLPRLGDEHSVRLDTSLLAPTGSPALGATAFSDVTVRLLPEFAVDRTYDADLGVRFPVYDF